MEYCEKTISVHLADTKPVKNELPYGSKYFGTAFIPKGENWPTCQCCKREMILVLQMLVSDLPEAPEGGLFDNDDMFQVFTCAYIDPHTESEYWNEHTQRPKVPESAQCFNNYKHSPHSVKAPNITFNAEEKSELTRLADPERHYFGHYDGELRAAYSPFRFLARTINIKGKEPTHYQNLPWIDAYHLKLNDEGEYVDALPKTKVSQSLKDYLYFWIDDRNYFVSEIAKQSLKITNWTQLNYPCGKRVKAHSIFNGCFSFTEESQFEGLPEDFASFSYLGSLTQNEHSVFERYEMSTYPNCSYCDKPMTLLCSFSLNHNDCGFAGGPLFGLFYSQQTASLKVICIDERR